MADDIRSTTPVSFEPTSREQTAFKLLELIYNNESPTGDERNDRRYWLTLYRQCLKATHGHTLETVLQKD